MFPIGCLKLCSNALSSKIFLWWCIAGYGTFHHLGGSRQKINPDSFSMRKIPAWRVNLTCGDLN